MRARQRPWTKADERKLRSLYPTTPVSELVTIFPERTEKAIKSRAKVLGARKAIGHGGRKIWTRRDDHFLRSTYPHLSTPDIAVALELPLHTVFARADKLGLTKSAAYQAERRARDIQRVTAVGVAHRFPKGHPPANKGLRRPGWYVGRMRETQFKKGQPPINTMPLWTFRFADGYLMLKTGKVHAPPNSGWEYVHKLIWEQANGRLPDRRVTRIWWKDGDHGNCSLSNLELVPGKEHVARTTVHNLPKELADVIQLTGALQRKINAHESCVSSAPTGLRLSRWRSRCRRRISSCLCSRGLRREAGG